MATPASPDLQQPTNEPRRPQRPSFVYGHEIGEAGVEPVRWLWEPYLAFGALSVLDGDPEVGKSLLTVDIAARLGTLRDFPDGKPAPFNPAKPRGFVRAVFVNGEDPVRAAILPRLLTAGGLPVNVMFLGGLGETNGRAVLFPDDLGLLADMLGHFPGSFVVLDTLMALLSPSIAAGNNQAIHDLLTPLARIAAETRSCILMLRHLNTRQSRRALYRGVGSIGILGACRTGLIVERHPDDPERRVLAMTKTNLGPRAPSLGFRVKVVPERTMERQFHTGERNPETGEVLTESKKFAHLIPPGPVIEWEGVSSLTADDLCFARPDATGPGLRAAAWLKKVLANGPVAATEIEKLAMKEDFGYRTVWAAKAKLKIESRLIVSDGQRRWEWMLPSES
jgi:hypothetical protein